MGEVSENEQDVSDNDITLPKKRETVCSVHTRDSTSCLSKTNLRRIVRELKASIKSWVRPVVLHQMRVKGKKDATMHSMKELQECRRLALVAIPKLLSQLEKRHTYLDQCSLFGYVTAYLASLYGHRLGVFLNMTDEQVSQAVYEPEGNDYLIKVEDHKTNESFGTAKLLLSDKEYGWFLAIIRLKRKWAKGVKLSKYVFHNTTFSADKNLTKYVKRAWSDMKLRGEATFTTLRTAVATFARDRHGEHSQERKTLARLMCHDTATSDKFYTMDLTMEQARRGRLLFEQAQKEGEESVTGTKKEEEVEEGEESVTGTKKEEEVEEGEESVTGTKKEEEVEEGEEDQDEEMQEEEEGDSDKEEEETAEVATSSKNNCTPSVTRSRSQKGCRVMLFPLKMSPHKALRMSPQKALRMSPQKALRMSPEKLTHIIRVRRNRMVERRRK
ncbi:uncharacterized protein LOC117560180 [Gymnodraco acuticeps]|uniref:Uncharacterized protein LOC117560180 n=1 Tax=Gymnodraco acuticeps TaxID=8218 RepID=A0A6P8W3B2_GYMAC|nr:uncharacterized protein LOC117560180 [Gymnodraco acuticeps]